MKKREEYTIAIADSILSLFRDEENGGNSNFHFELSEVDATAFITSMAAGCNIVYSQLTNDNKSNIEFTHLLNLLVVQSMIEDIENKEDD